MHAQKCFRIGAPPPDSHSMAAPCLQVAGCLVLSTNCFVTVTLYGSVVGYCPGPDKTVVSAPSWT